MGSSSHLGSISRIVNAIQSKNAPVIEDFQSFRLRDKPKHCSGATTPDIAEHCGG